MYKDYYWLNKDSRLFLERGYLSKGESPEQRIRDIAENAEKILKIKGFADKFESYMKRGWISLSSPIWSNYGNSKGLPCSCNGQLLSDTMESILDNASETGIMTKVGAGTSAYFGNLRARGTKISVGGESSGPVHFMEIFNSISNVVSQSSVRRGSFAAYLNIDHPNIDEFLRIKSDGHSIQDISIGVTISDKWMEEMLGGNKENRKIWGSVIRKRFESGYPYLFFTDSVNNNKPKCYLDKGIHIPASNLCVVGSERVVSDRGILTAKELYEQGGKLVLFDNVSPVNSSEMKLIEENAEVFKVTLENGMTHTITEYHKLSVFDKRIQKKKSKQTIVTKNIQCKDLKIGDSVAIQTQKGIFGSKHMPKEAFLLGMYQGDGTQSEKEIMIDVWENDFDLISEIQECHDYICEKYKTQQSSNNRVYNKAQFRDACVSQSKVKKKSLKSNALKKALDFKKGFIPNWIWESDEKTQWQYIRGLFYTDGTAGIYSGKGDAIQISLASINREWLQEVQILLANLGMQTSIRILRKAGEMSLPDGRGGYKMYKTKDCWRLIIGNKNDALVFEKNTNFLSRKGFYIKDRVYRNNTKKFHKVLSIESVGKEDVYCCEIYNNKHLWVCNGIVTHNCSETAIPAGEDFSFVCVLSSVNLLHYDQWKDTDLIETMTYFLDSVTEEYIKKTKNIKHLQKAHKFAKEHRSVGLGVLGWHSYLQSQMIPFESMAAKYKNSEIFKFINEKSLKASREMAITYGEPEVLIGYGERMTTRLAIAPTTSSSFILGQISPSIEPENSNYYIKNLAKGKFTYKNPFLTELLKIKDKDTKEVWDSILKKGGSVQHLKFLSQEEKDVFKTFSEISQKEIVIQAAQRQKYIDQSQSLNLTVSSETKPKEVSDLLIEGWKLGIKTFYYQRGANPAQELSRSINSCKSCEA